MNRVPGHRSWLWTKDNESAKITVNEILQLFKMIRLVTTSNMINFTIVLLIIYVTISILSHHSTNLCVLHFLSFLFFALNRFFRFSIPSKCLFPSCLFKQKGKAPFSLLSILRVNECERQNVSTCLSKTNGSN